MIFARVDVTLGQHHRVLEIPPGIRAECLGVWLLMLLWTRGAERDGWCPRRALDHIARDKVLVELERVGLVSREADDSGVHGWRLLRYEQHNELKVEIDERKSKDRRRKHQAIPRGVRSDSNAGVRSDSAGSSSRPRGPARPRSEPEPESEKEREPDRQDVHRAYGTETAEALTAPLLDGRDGALIGSNFEDERRRQLEALATLSTDPSFMAAGRTGVR